MKAENFIFKGSDDTRIFTNKWSFEEDIKPKGIVQIAHGMAEHSSRYIDFAKVLVDSGFTVYANDHRGHGKTAASHEDIGYFGDENGWNLVVEDMHTLTNIIQKENPNVPIFLFGHSMGSFLSRAYIQHYSKEVKGVILSGTGGSLGMFGNVGILLSKREIKRIGKRARSKRMDKLSFGNFNKGFKPNRTDFDWLSRDKKEVDKYINDPLCGEIFTAGFFYDMLIGLQELMKKENIKKIRKELPIYLISGDKDPVGKNTKGVTQAYKAYKSAGIKDVSYKFYKDARHEILNETNKDEVYKDIVAWLNKKC